MINAKLLYTGAKWRSSVGKAVVVWVQIKSAYPYSINSVWANRFDGAAWGAAEIIDTNIIGSNAFPYPNITIDGVGNACLGKIC
jgi:hypothetical protein